MMHIYFVRNWIEIEVLVDKKKEIEVLIFSANRLNIFKINIIISEITRA